MKFLRPSEMDWMFCKKKWTVECFQFVLPLVVHLFSFLFFCLQSWLFVLSGRNIAKYILHTYCILAGKDNFCSLVSNL